MISVPAVSANRALKKVLLSVALFPIVLLAVVKHLASGCSKELFPVQVRDPSVSSVAFVAIDAGPLGPSCNTAERNLAW